MILYGRNAVREAFKSGRKIYELYLFDNSEETDDILAAAEKGGVKVIYKDRKEMKDVTGTDKNQGIAIRAEGFSMLALDEFLNKNRDNTKITIAVLDDVTDPHNVGAVIRSAEVLGIDAVMLSGQTAPLNDAVYKTSSGAVEYLPVIKAGNINMAMKKLKEAGFWIYGFDITGDKSPEECEFDPRTVFIFGSEGEGMKRLVKENCDFLVKIRQAGKLDSLNISNAATIAFYERNRKRQV